MNVQDFKLAYEINKERLEFAEQMRRANKIKKQKPNLLTFLKTHTRSFKVKPAHS